MLYNVWISQIALPHYGTKRENEIVTSYLKNKYDNLLGINNNR